MEEISLNLDNNSTQNPTHKNGLVIILVFLGIVLFSVLVFLTVFLPLENGKTRYVTYQNYQKIQNGMTYEQVVKIMDGHYGSLESSSSFLDITTNLYIWTDTSSNSTITVIFSNGTVFSKSQFGLT